MKRLNEVFHIKMHHIFIGPQFNKQCKVLFLLSSVFESLLYASLVSAPYTQAHGMALPGVAQCTAHVIVW